LQQVGSVDVVVLDQQHRDPSSIGMPDGEFKVEYALPVEPRPNKGWIDKLRWTFDPERLYPNGLGVGGAGVTRLFRSLDEFELAWFFMLVAPDMFPRREWGNSVVDISDVPSTLARTHLRIARGLGDRLQAYRRLWMWGRREKLVGDRFAVLAVCTEGDRQYLQRRGVKVPIHVIPNGFDKPTNEPVRSPAEPPRIGFIGTFAHFPNRDGIEWFVKNCWSRIKQEVPAARLRLVGSGSNGPLKPVGPDIDGLGYVADPAGEIKTWSAMVTPIRMGGGTRVKVAQAFSQKCPLVSTSLGAHGYDAVDGHNMSLADSADAFAAACVRVIREPESAAQMADRAWHQFLEKWTWEAISPRVWAAAEDCLRRRNGG
jgi:glycosyltransferase involved in cell wall biosynthesis